MLSRGLDAIWLITMAKEQITKIAGVKG